LELQGVAGKSLQEIEGLSLVLCPAQMVKNKEAESRDSKFKCE
jgi:hypothetical protein